MKKIPTFCVTLFLILSILFGCQTSLHCSLAMRDTIFLSNKVYTDTIYCTERISPSHYLILCTLKVRGDALFFYYKRFFLNIQSLIHSEFIVIFTLHYYFYTYDMPFFRLKVLNYLSKEEHIIFYYIFFLFIRNHTTR